MRAFEAATLEQPLTSPNGTRAKSAKDRPRWIAGVGLYALLTLGTLLVHGYHPFAEDGGLYAAGIERLLNPRLFPHYTSFATEHLRFSVFAPVLVALLHLTHLSLQWGLLLAYLLSTFLLFAGAGRLLRKAVRDRASLGGLLLLFAWWTLPVAGTSLFLEDPYLTARSCAAPLCIFAISLAMERTGSPRSHRRRWLACVALLAAATALHPLMCGYAAALLLCMLAVQARRWELWSAGLCIGALGLGSVLQAWARPESGASLAADLSRYYWFLSRWQWFELLGLAGPLLVLFALQRWTRGALRPAGRDLCRACLVLGVIATSVSVAFAHADGNVHVVARLQPLRSFVWIYFAMVLLLGSVALSYAGKLLERTEKYSPWRRAPLCLILALAGGMFLIQRTEFAHSHHLELPGRLEYSPNAWVQAFRWVRLHTPEDALFAIDAHYITRADEDAQTFRALAERSVLPDFSKDGGEASITPSLATLWDEAQRAQLGLDRLDDTERDRRLAPFGVNWVVLAASARTRHSCPYVNGEVKVCRLDGTISR